MCLINDTSQLSTYHTTVVRLETELGVQLTLRDNHPWYQNNSLDLKNNLFWLPKDDVSKLPVVHEDLIRRKLCRVIDLAYSGSSVIESIVNTHERRPFTTDTLSYVVR